MISNPKTLGSVFAIHGEAGTGKTTLIKDGLIKSFWVTIYIYTH